MAALEIVSLDTATPQLRAPASGDTYTAPRAFALAPESLTGTAATSSLSIAQTWNTTGTPTAFDLLVTDTASNAASRFFQFRTAARTVLQLRKDGLLQGAGPSSGAFVIGSTTEFRPGFLAIGFQPSGASGGVGFGADSTGSNSVTAMTNLGIHVVGAASIGFAATLSGDRDTILARDAANTLAQRNGVNAQAFNVYNTYTDASNYERLEVKFASNVAILQPTALGTGTARSLVIRGGPTAPGGFRFINGSVVNEYGLGFSVGTDAASRVVLYPIADKVLRLTDNGSGGAAFQLVEMTAPAAPTANGVRIYAEDDGAGKTRLMALFATGSAVQIAIEP